MYAVVTDEARVFEIVYTRRLLIMPSSLNGVPIISSEIELLENRGAILLTLFSDSEFPWGAILSDFFKVSWSIFYVF